jgi:hypothetical protein
LQALASPSLAAEKAQLGGPTNLTALNAAVQATQPCQQSALVLLAAPPSEPVTEEHHLSVSLQQDVQPCDTRYQTNAIATKSCTGRQQYLFSGLQISSVHTIASPAAVRALSSLATQEGSPAGAEVSASAADHDLVAGGLQAQETAQALQYLRAHAGLSLSEAQAVLGRLTNFEPPQGRVCTSLCSTHTNCLSMPCPNITQTAPLIASSAQHAKLPHPRQLSFEHELRPALDFLLTLPGLDVKACLTRFPHILGEWRQLSSL